jgi:Leucine-rich repeat (LRR) protein
MIYLNLSNNNLKDISSKVKGLKNVVSINLANNQLTDLPKEFQLLKNLKTLILVGNPMEKATIQQLKELLPQTQIYF